MNVSTLDGLQQTVFAQICSDPMKPQDVVSFSDDHRRASDLATQEAIRVLKQREHRPVREIDRRRASQETWKQVCGIGLLGTLGISVLTWIIQKALDAVLRWWRGEDGVKHVVCGWNLPGETQ